MKIQSFALSDWQTNCFVVHPDDPSNHLAGDATPCWLVDVGLGPKPMLDYIAQHNLTPKAIVLTHAHVDHIAGVNDARAAYPDLPIHIHPQETAFLNNPELNLSAFLATPVTAPEPAGELTDGMTLDWAGQSVRVKHVPGHSPGSVALIFEGCGEAIVGDTLFAGSVGRTDFPTSDTDTLLRSIRDVLYALPDETTIHPGHGPTTTIGAEKRSNPFVSG